MAYWNSSKNNMIPYARQHISRRDIAAVAAAAGSDWLTQGPRVRDFETALAAYCGARYAVACSSGTAGLHLAYLAAGIGKGDEIITSPNTFAATANMALATGARPVFCDIRMDTYNLDEQDIAKRITKKTKAIVPVHFAGQAADMPAIKSIAKKHKLLIIEDACHALGARLGKERVGSCKYSDMAVFSFHAVKPITTAEGGAILTNSKKYYEKLVLLRSHGVKKDKNGFNVMTELGYNYRLTELQAALGLSQLKKLNAFIRKRRAAVRVYEQGLKDLEAIILPQEAAGNYSGWHVYVIRTKKASDRLPLYRHLQKLGIGANFHFPAVYSHPYYQELGYTKNSCPNMEAYHKTAITLPLYPDLTGTEIRRVIRAIKDFYAG